MGQRARFCSLSQSELVLQSAFGERLERARLGHDHGGAGQRRGGFAHGFGDELLAHDESLLVGVGENPLF